MADDDAEQQRPSLEPPKLFRRRGRTPRPTPEDAPAETTTEDATPAEVVAPEPVPEEPVREDPIETDVVDAPEPVVDDEPAEEPAEEPEDEAGPAPVVLVDDVEPEPEPVVEPEPRPELAPVAPTADDPADSSDPGLDTEDTDGANDTDDTDDEPGFTDAATVPVHVGGDRDERAPDPRPDDVPAPAEEREPRGPLLVGRNAALLTGLLVGVLLVLLSAGGSATCTAIRGTSACGAALGFPVIVVILALATVAGALLLRLLKLPAPGSTSFMAVALLGVVTGLFLGDSLDSWVVRLAYPFGSALAFLGAWWLTVSFDDPEVVRMAREEREQEVA